MSWTDKERNGLRPTYEAIARALGPAAVVVELGVLTGGSLELWQALFPAGLVVGVDNDPDATWPAGTVRVVADQDDPVLPEAIRLARSTLPPAGSIDQVDLVVDDASHLGELTARSFMHLWPIVRAGGYYVIEDWEPRPVGGDIDYSMWEYVHEFPMYIQTESEIESVTFQKNMVIIRKL